MLRQTEVDVDLSNELVVGFKSSAVKRVSRGLLLLG